VRLLAARVSNGTRGLLPYFLSAAPDSMKVVMLDSLLAQNPADTLARYLKGRALLRLGRNSESLGVLDNVKMMASNSTLEAIRLKSEGLALYRLGRYQKAREMFWLSLNAVQNDAAHAEVEDWIQRCEWMEQHFAPSRF